MTFTFTITNQDGSYAGFKVSDYSLDKYFDRHGELDLDCYDANSISENSSIEASYKGSIRYRGYIDYPKKQDDGTVKIESYEIQRLLEFRQLQIYNYPAGTTVSNIIGSGTPGSVAGILYFGNSLVPQGAFSQYSGSKYYLRDYAGRGAGTSSLFGTITAVYQNATLLTKAASLAAMTAGTWFQDASEFYLWTTDSKDPAYWNISVPNWKDTGLRIGNVDSSVASKTFSVPYRTSKGSVADELYKIIDAFGLEYQWRHSADGYTYLDIQETVGRGTSTRGVTAYREGTNIYGFERELTGDPKISALLGAGYGSGLSQNTAASLDLFSGGTWKEELVTTNNLFSSQLQAVLAKEFPDRKNGTSYVIETQIDPSLNPGDYIDIFSTKYSPVTERVKAIRYNYDGTMKVEAGRRLLVPSEVNAKRFSLLESFTSMANSYLSSWNFSFNNDAISESAPYTIRFTVATHEIDTSFDYRFLMSLTLDWYKSTVSTVTTAAHGHKNRTGSGSSSSHGNAGSGGGHYHEVSGATSMAEPDSYHRIVIDGLGTMSFAGAHSHSASGSSTGPSAAINVIGSLGTMSSAGAHSHSASGSSTGPSAAINVVGSLGTMSSAGEHSHSASGSSTGPSAAINVIGSLGTMSSTGNHSHSGPSHSHSVSGGTAYTSASNEHDHTYWRSSTATGFSGTASTGSGGSHSHSVPNHQHTIGYYFTNTGVVDDHSHPHHIRSSTTTVGGEGSTSSAGSHSHSVPSHSHSVSGATAYTGSASKHDHTYWRSSTETGFSGTGSTSSAGSHNHSYPWTTPASVASSGHSHSISVSVGSVEGHNHSYPWATPASVASSDHSHSISVSVGSVEDHNHSYPWATPASVASSGHNHNISVSVESVEDHNHSYPWATPASVSSAGHVHDVSGQTTATHTGHSNHSVTDNPQPGPLDVYTETADDDSIIHDSTFVEVGSIRYMDVSIKCNGSHVPGSPFIDYYPGDSINDVDITSLINVGSENTLQISIAETAGGGRSVKCSVNGSVSSKYYITDI